MTTTVLTELECNGSGLDCETSVLQTDCCVHEHFASKLIAFFASGVNQILNDPTSLDGLDQIAATFSLTVGYAMHAGVRKEDILRVFLENLSKNDTGKTKGMMTDTYTKMWNYYHQPAHPNGTTPSDLFQEMIQQAAKHKDNEKGG